MPHVDGQRDDVRELHDGLHAHRERLGEGDDDGHLADLGGLEATVAAAPGQKGRHAAAAHLGHQQREHEQANVGRVDGVGVLAVELVGEEYDDGHGNQPGANPHQLESGIEDRLRLQHLHHVGRILRHLAGRGGKDADDAEQGYDQNNQKQRPVEVFHQAPVELIVPDVLEKCSDSREHSRSPCVSCRVPAQGDVEKAASASIQAGDQSASVYSEVTLVFSRFLRLSR